MLRLRRPVLQGAVLLSSLNMKTVVVGSNNPVKLATIEDAFKKVFPQETFKFVTHTAMSGVSDQPMGIQETKQGAFNRAEDCRKHHQADYFVGLEGGIEDIDGEYWTSAWMCVMDAAGKVGFGRTSAFLLPPKITTLIKSGVELGHATDQVFNEINTKQKGGVIDFLTKGVIDRKHFYTDAVVFALIPFVSEELY